MSDDADAAAEAAPAKSSSKILPLMLVVNTLLLSGVLVFVMKRPSAQAAGGKDEHAEGKGEHAASAEKPEKGEHGEKAAKGEGHGGEGEHDSDGPGPVYRLDAFIVQVRSVEGDRYAHITIEVELGSEGDKKWLESRMPRIRDSVIAYLSDRTEDELRGSEGLAQMKTALAKKIDEVVPGHRVRGLFTTEFIIQ
jgi:flagellar FliL protein